MRRIFWLLRGGNKNDLFLLLSLLKLTPTKPNSLGKRKEMTCTKCFGTGTVFSHSYKITHHSARLLPLAGRWLSMGTTHCLCSASRSQQKADELQPLLACWQTQQPKNHFRTHYIFSYCFPTWCLPAGGLQVTVRGLAEVFQKNTNYWMLSQARWQANRMGKSKSKNKHSKFSLVGTQL